MKHLKYLLPLLVSAAFFILSCEKEPEVQNIPDNYSSWERINDVELNYPVPGHESNYRVIYMNEKGRDVDISMEEGRRRYEFPQGTVVAKAVYEGLDPAPDAEPVMITAMVKNKEHPAARGGWVWVLKNLNTGDERIIEEAFCFTCHAAANESHPYGDGNPEEEYRDYVFFASE